MSRKSKLSARIDSGLVEVKSKFDAEFRRFSLTRQSALGYDEFYQMIESLHCLQYVPFMITYTDPEGDLLPINNNENFAVAIANARPLLRLHIQHKGQSVLELSGYGTAQRRKNKLSKFVPSSVMDVRTPHPPISLPEDFRRVSAVIDVDIIPPTQRRVRLMKSGVDASKPLGFYIRDGSSIRVTPNGVDKVPGIFISRLVPGGIAESTGLLAVNDEVMEVNGIEVAGKTLDQVTDMMVANSSNMIITVKPANQNNNIRRVVPGMLDKTAGSGSHNSSDSYRSARSGESVNLALIENDEEDEVTEYMGGSSQVYDQGTVQHLTWHASNDEERELHEISEVPTSSDESSMDDVSSRIKPSDVDLHTDSLKSITRVADGISEGSDRRSSSGTSSRSTRSYENATGQGGGYNQDGLSIGSGQSSMRARDGTESKNLQQLLNHSEVKPAAGVKVVFTPVDDL